MKRIILTLIIGIFLVFFIEVKAQPYIYYGTQITDTTFGQLEKVVRYNLLTNTIEDFLPQQTPGKYVWTVCDPSLSYLIIYLYREGYDLYDCSNFSNSYDLGIWGSQIHEVLFSVQRNNLYIFSNEYRKLSAFNFSSETIASEINLGKAGYYNDLMEPLRTSFFSLDSSKIYFDNMDITDIEQIWTYSLATNEIIGKSDLSELGYPGTNGYELRFGRNGKGIISSYPDYNNPVRNFYYRIYDFDNYTGSDFIYHNGLSEAYFANEGDFLLIMNTFKNDTTWEYYHTGEGYIYNAQNGQLLKTLNLPSHGKIYTFDNYPNNIYYVIDIEKPTRQIYTLKMDSIFNVLDLTSINPSTATVNSSSFTLTVNGHGFDTLSTVYFNDTAKTTTYISDSVLTAEISATDISIVGSYPVWVTDEWGTSDTLMFTVVPQTPYLSKISPSLALPYDVFTKKSSFNVIVIGNNFTTSSVAYFNGTAKTTTYISDSLITFQLNSGDVGINEKIVSVWIQNSNQFSDTLLFNVLATLPNQITPILECVRENGANSYTAYFGYNNYNSEDVLIPFGTKNNISSQFSSITGSPVNIFLSGRQTNVFSIDFNGQEIFWNLNGTRVSASSKSPPCP